MVINDSKDEAFLAFDATTLQFFIGVVLISTPKSSMSGLTLSWAPPQNAGSPQGDRILPCGFSHILGYWMKTVLFAF